VGLALGFFAFQKIVPKAKSQLQVYILYLYEYVEDINTGFNSTGERAPIDGVREQI